MKDAKFVDVNGIKTRYFEAGQGDNLVLISGGRISTFYNAYYWKLNFEELSRHFHVYAFDKIGMGYTDNPKTDSDYTMGAMIEHARGFLHALDIRKATLVGHSRGALPAARIAADEPELTQNLILFDGNSLPAEDANEPKNFYSDLEKNAPPIPDREYVLREPKANSHTHGHITEDFIEEMLRIGRQPKLLEARAKMKILDPQFLANMTQKKNETLELIKAGRLKAPTLIIWGRNDVSSPMKVGIDLFNTIGSVVERTQFHAFNNAGHYVFREHPREVNELMINFMKTSTQH